IQEVYLNRQWDEAIKLIESLKILDQNDLLIKARSQFNLGEFSASLQTYKKCLELAEPRESTALQLEIAACLFKTEAYKKVLQYTAATVAPADEKTGKQIEYIEFTMHEKALLDKSLWIFFEEGKFRMPQLIFAYYLDVLCDVKTTSVETLEDDRVKFEKLLRVGSLENAANHLKMSDGNTNYKIILMINKLMSQYHSLKRELYEQSNQALSKQIKIF
ncbi:unnamed protein product, partial [marine sediment metagenome]